MPRRTLGPFAELANLPAIDSTDDMGLMERMDLVNEILAAAGCHCNGHAAGHQRDEYWGADLSELVSRCAVHDIRSEDGVISVSIKLETLRVEVDGNNEICAWIYEES